MNRDDVIKFIDGKVFYYSDYINFLYKQLELKDNIIKEVREYIEKHTENIDRGRYYEDYVETYPILEILDKEGKWTNNINGTTK